MKTIKLGDIYDNAPGGFFKELGDQGEPVEIHAAGHEFILVPKHMLVIQSSGCDCGGNCGCK